MFQIVKDGFMSELLNFLYPLQIFSEQAADMAACFFILIFIFPLQLIFLKQFNSILFSKMFYRVIQFNFEIPLFFYFKFFIFKYNYLHFYCDIMEYASWLSHAKPERLHNDDNFLLLQPSEELGGFFLNYCFFSFLPTMFIASSIYSSHVFSYLVISPLYINSFIIFILA